MEILLYEIDFFRMLMNHRGLHDYLNQQLFIRTSIDMLAFHQNEKIVKALGTALSDASNSTSFFPELLNDKALNIILCKIIEHETQPSSLQPLYECINSILLKTKAPVKYLVAATLLRLTESDEFEKIPMKEASVLYLIKVLQSILKCLDASLGLLQNGPALVASEQS